MISCHQQIFARRLLGPIVLLLATLVVSCEQKDQGVQAELLQLKAERAQLLGRVGELESSLKSKSEEVNTLTTRLSKESGVESFDKQVSMNQFIAKVAELKNDLQRKFPDAQLTDSVQMPGFDAPLQSEVRIDIQRPGQAVKSFVWIGRGTLAGEWNFTQSQEGDLTASPANHQSKSVEAAPTALPSPPPKADDADAGDTGQSQSASGNQSATPNSSQPSDVPAGSRVVREDAHGKVWLTPDGRYIIKLNQ